MSWWSELTPEDLQEAGWKEHGAGGAWTHRDFVGCVFDVHGARRIEAMKGGEFVTIKAQARAEIADLTGRLDDIAKWFVDLDRIWSEIQHKCGGLLMFIESDAKNRKNKPILKETAALRQLLDDFDKTLSGNAGTYSEDAAG